MTSEYNPRELEDSGHHVMMHGEADPVFNHFIMNGRDYLVCREYDDSSSFYVTRVEFNLDSVVEPGVKFTDPVSAKTSAQRHLRQERQQ